MMYEFVDDPQRWLSIYHMRSISETANATDKTRFPWKLKKGLAWRKDPVPNDARSHRAR